MNLLLLEVADFIAADRVILRTTEAVPTAVARTADPNMAVFELEAPQGPA